MSRLSRAAAVVVVLWSAAALAKTPLQPSTSPSTLIISCLIEGADVFVDGNKVGVTPLPPLPLTPGEHTVKVLKLGFAPLIDVFTINKKKETKLEVDLVPVAGVIKVTANVEQAHVFVDGKFVGEAPITTELQVGARAIQVSKAGYKDYFQNIEAVAGQQISVEVLLEELPEGLNPYKPPPPPPPKWYEKWWVWTAGAAGVAVVVTAIVVPVVLTSNNDPVKSFGPNYTFSINNNPMK